MNKFTHLNEWFKLPDSTKQNIFTETGKQIGLPPFAVEKDWWLTHALAVMFSMDCSTSLVFKGGTSLSKAWNLIERFSEDIDIALNREYLGFNGELVKADVRRLRRVSYKFITNEFTQQLKEKFALSGFEEVNINCRDVENHDQDPLIIEIYYPKLTETDAYLKPGLLIEIGSRSLIEPFSNKLLTSFVSEKYSASPFADNPITIPSVTPEKTFLEKIFLLHEEFQRPDQKRRVEGLSRHLYDIERINRTNFAASALSDKNLFNAIVNHRKTFTHVSGIDYKKHNPKEINFIPPDELLPSWERDYNQMQENMIYGEKLPFRELLERLKELNKIINL
ncbi:MAG: nucleotidyl transferase AbiEii/AbiGii toxin family protein [Ignavibacteriaceae bacterium]